MNAVLNRLHQTGPGEGLGNAKDAAQEDEQRCQNKSDFPAQILVHNKICDFAICDWQFTESQPQAAPITDYFVVTSSVVTDTMDARVTSIFKLSGGTLKVTASSFMAKMVPRIPPLVTTLSPVLRVSSMACHFFCRRCCGRIRRK